MGIDLDEAERILDRIGAILSDDDACRCHMIDQACLVCRIDHALGGGSEMWTLEHGWQLVEKEQPAEDGAVEMSDE